MATLALPAAAQQLPNAGFENDWVDCVPWDSNNSKTKKGQVPTPWCISHVGGTVSANELGKKVAGNGSEWAVEIDNKEVMSKNIPGYFTLGTTWSTAKGFTASNKDGGTFGGLEFSYSPDAIGFSYKRVAKGDTYSTVVVYSWKGSWTQASVPGNIAVIGSPKTVSMTNRDRNILGMSTAQGGAVTHTSDAELISSFIDKETIKGSTEGDVWNEYFHEITYNSKSIPQMFNIIIAVADYFDESKIVSGESLTVDDVKLYYYSRLKSIAFNGGEPMTDLAEGETYNVNGSYDAAAVEAVLLGQSAEATYSYDAETRVLEVTVSNVDADRDGKTSHTYTFQFAGDTKPEIKGDPYNAFLNVWLDPTKNEDTHIGINQMAQVVIDHAESDCVFALKDFSIIGINVGDVVVPNTSYITDGEGNKTYSGSVENLAITEGDLAGMTLNVTVDGTIMASGEIDLNINVVVPMLQDMFESIPVTFTTRPWGAQMIAGKLNGSMMGMTLFENEDKTVMIYPTLSDDGETRCSVFALNDFMMDLGDGPMNLGDIVVSNTVTEQDGKSLYSGYNPELPLADGAIVAEVTLNGEITERGAAKMIIDVIWNGIPIPVTFTTYPIMSATLFGEESPEIVFVGIDDLFQLKHELDSESDEVSYTFDADDIIEITQHHLIKPLKLGEVNVTAQVNGATPASLPSRAGARVAAKTHSFKVIVLTGDNGTSTTGIENVMVAPAGTATEIYDLRGVRVNGDALAPGLYISRSGNKVEKIIVR